MDVKPCPDCDGVHCPSCDKPMESFGINALILPVVERFGQWAVFRCAPCDVVTFGPTALMPSERFSDMTVEA